MVSAQSLASPSNPDSISPCAQLPLQPDCRRLGTTAAFSDLGQEGWPCLLSSARYFSYNPSACCRALSPAETPSVTERESINTLAGSHCSEWNPTGKEGSPVHKTDTSFETVESSHMHFAFASINLYMFCDKRCRQKCKKLGHFLPVTLSEHL